MSVLERCPSYRKSNKRSKERQGPTLSVRLIEVSVLQRCPSYGGVRLIEVSAFGGVRFTEMFVLQRLSLIHI